MDNVVFIKIFKSVQNLFEVLQYVFFTSNLLRSVEMSKITVKIFIIAIFENKVNSLVFGIANNILNLDDIGISSLLSCKCHNFLNFLDLPNVARNANNL